MGSKRLLFLAAAVLLTCPICYCWTTQGQASATSLPNATLITQTGSPVKFFDDLIKGRTVVVEFICTECNKRELQQTRLGDLRKRLGNSLGKEIFFYSITVDPERDTPQALRVYAERYHAGPGWSFLTGTNKDIELVTQALIALDGPDPADRPGSTQSLLFGNAATGHWKRTSAFDYPSFLLTLIDDLLDEGRNTFDPSGYTRQASSGVERARYVFRTECTGCHTIGRGDRVGPDLQFVTQRRRPQWLRDFISGPSKLIDSHDTTATALYERFGKLRMPTIGLSDADVTAMIEFLSKPEMYSGQPNAPR